MQVNTGAGCHLDASMVQRALEELQPPAGGVVVLENVGNLVCPALFDLGESRKVVVISVTEGDDKPLKYPRMFAAADLVVVNKTDLLPYVDFDVDRCEAPGAQHQPGRRVAAALGPVRRESRRLVRVAQVGMTESANRGIRDLCQDVDSRPGATG